MIHVIIVWARIVKGAVYCSVHRLIEITVLHLLTTVLAI